MSGEESHDSLDAPQKVLQTSARLVMGIGASAGGLEALRDLLSNLPDNLPVAVIIAQHMSPTHKSVLVDILKKDSALSVCAAESGQILQPARVYVCPPNCHIMVADGDRIILSELTGPRQTPNPSVDLLFESIAEKKGRHSLGVILSGTGSDGSHGIRAIKAEGGFVIVQDPDEAKHDGMPRSALSVCNVDFVLPASHIGEEILTLLQSPFLTVEPDKLVFEREIYKGILKLVEVQTQVDFTLYKESTISRRIERRMASLKIDSAEAYYQYLFDHSDEVTRLYRDFLIGVTSFFRDPPTFEVLRKEFANYLKTKKDKNIRIWCVGCSTGEEPYTIAIVLHQLLNASLDKFKVQIFATDIDENALSFARKGSYAESALHNLPAEVRKNYFLANAGRYEIIKEIKSLVIFSLHNIISDPPFIRLDLVSCRNLLIYLNGELQKQLLPTFHFALNPGGLLLLGKSESTGVYQEQFRPLSKATKIYESVFVGRRLPLETAPIMHRPHHSFKDLSETSLELQSSIGEEAKSSARFNEIISSGVKKLALPNAILINEAQNIVFVDGSNPILIRPQGAPSDNIFKNLHPDIAIDLRSALHELSAGHEVCETGFIKYPLQEKAIWLKLLLMNIPRADGSQNFVLIFAQMEDVGSFPVMDSTEELPGNLVFQEQERVLLKTKGQLQDVIEELETSNEEMQSMNEELQSANEELQSSNEELETTNEELHSTNEELQTAYAELRLAYEEREQQRGNLLRMQTQLEQANRLLHDAEKAARMGSWLWNIETRQLTWSNGCYELFGLERDKFHPSYEAFIGLAYQEHRASLEKHLEELTKGTARQPFLFEATTIHKERIIISLEAVVSYDDLKRATKVMGTMTDITNKLLYEKEDQLNKDKISYILNSSLNAACVYNVPDKRIEYINPQFTKLFGYTYKALVQFEGPTFNKLFALEDRRLVEDVLASVAKSAPGSTHSSSYIIRSVAGENKKVYANHTIYEIDQSSMQAVRLLVTLFIADS